MVGSHFRACELPKHSASGSFRLHSDPGGTGSPFATRPLHPTGNPFDHQFLGPEPTNPLGTEQSPWEYLEIMPLEKRGALFLVIDKGGIPFPQDKGKEKWPRGEVGVSFFRPKWWSSFWFSLKPCQTWGYRVPTQKNYAKTVGVLVLSQRNLPKRWAPTQKSMPKLWFAFVLSPKKTPNMGGGNQLKK